MIDAKYGNTSLQRPSLSGLEGLIIQITQANRNAHAGNGNEDFVLHFPSRTRPSCQGSDITKMRNVWEFDGKVVMKNIYLNNLHLMNPRCLYPFTELYGPRGKAACLR